MSIFKISNNKNVEKKFWKKILIGIRNWFISLHLMSYTQHTTEDISENNELCRQMKWGNWRNENYIYVR